jgi:STE24 endopeptidase
VRSSTILAIYIGIAALDFFWGLFLSALNYRSAARGGKAVPPELEGSVSPEEAAKSSAYSQANMRFSFVEEPLSTVLTVSLAAAGVFGLLDRALEPAAAALGGSAFVHGALFFLVLALASGLLSAPFSLYSTFVLEKRYGFNTTTLKTWLLDGLKSAAVSAVLGLPLLWLLFAFMDAAGGLWWLWAAVIFSVLDLLISLLYPLVIAPLFNKFTPLPAGSLRDRIESMARGLDFRMSGIYVMDSSKRSRHSNAYFTGLGRVKRVVLYDTLVSSMGEEEILAVLGHEIGHEKRKHIVKMTAVSIAFSFLGFYALSLLAAWPELYAAFGFVAPGGAPAPTKEALLLIFGLISGPATFFLTPLMSLWSRRHEYEADRFAVKAVDAAGSSGREALSSALTRLNRENASNLWPHPLYSFWYYSHPTLVERLRAIKSVDDK